MNLNEIPQGGFGRSARLDVLDFEDRKFSEQAYLLSQNLRMNQSVREHLQDDINSVGISIIYTQLDQIADFRISNAQHDEALDLSDSINNVITIHSATEEEIEQCVKEVPDIRGERLLNVLKIAINEIEQTNSDFQEESERAQKAIEGFRKSSQV